MIGSVMYYQFLQIKVAAPKASSGIAIEAAVLQIILDSVNRQGLSLSRPGILS